jgi:hypothetical protein
MLKDLPPSLLKASRKVLDEEAAMLDSCIESEVTEDAVSAMDIPGDDEPEEELSGEKEEVIINPEYKTFRQRLPY